MLQGNGGWKNRWVGMVAAFALGCVPAFAGTYRVQELPLAPDASVTPHALNNKGAVAGGVGEAHGGNIAMFVSDGGPGAAGPKVHARAVGSSYTEAMSMNDNGQIAGAMNGESALTAFTWDARSGMHTLAPLAGDNGSTAAAINNRGWIAGTSMGAGGIRAVVWKATTTPTMLAQIHGASSSTALAIDQAGNIAGWASVNGVKHAVLWTAAGEARDLGMLAGENTEASGIASGQVVGLAEKSGETRAFLWTAERGMLDLGMLAGGTHSEAFAINGAGNVVGSSGSSAGLRAFLWSGSGMVDLNKTIPSDSNLVLTVAVAINDHGQILALGSRHHDLGADKSAKMDMHTHAGATRAFLLTPQ
jgi:probable HAF family extracellular repeat protein